MFETQGNSAFYLDGHATLESIYSAEAKAARVPSTPGSGVLL